MCYRCPFALCSVAEIPIDFIHISFGHCCECRRQRSASFQFIYVDVDPYLIAYRFACISYAIMIGILLSCIHYKDAIIHPSCRWSWYLRDVDVSVIIHDSDGIFYSVAVDIIVADVSYTIIIRISLMRIIIVRAVVLCIRYSITIIVIIERTTHFIVEFE